MASIHKRSTTRGETRWEVRYRDPTRKSKSEWFKRQADAQHRANELETDKRRGTYVDPNGGRVQLENWITDWHEGRVNLRPSSRIRDESYIRNHIIPEFGTNRINSIQAIHVRNWVKRKTQEGYAPATVRKFNDLLRAALDMAVSDGLIIRNPASGVPLPHVEKTEMRFLSADEVWKLGDVITGRYRALVLTGAFTGLRPGELFGLTVDKLDMLRRTAQVDRQLRNERGKVFFGPLKTPASRRKVTLPVFLVDELAAHIAEHGLGRDGLVFAAPRGGPIRKDTFRRRAWIPAVIDSVGLPMRPHDLRHTHAALLVEQGQHPKVIQARLGHESIKTTFDRYGHLMDGLDEAAAESLDEAYAATSALNGQRHFGSV